MRRIAILAAMCVTAVLSYLAGSTTAESSIVSFAGVGIIAFERMDNGPPRVLDEDGVVWIADEDYGWSVDASIPPLPVAPGDVKYWAYDTLSTYSGHVWRVGGGEWRDAGLWPGEACATQRTTWGKLKSSFRD
jgi:hypothetical protein